MKIDTDNLVSLTEANRNFSKVARLVDESGSAIILKNNRPCYVVLEFSQIQSEQSAQSEELLQIAERVLEKYHNAFEELAK